MDPPRDSPNDKHGAQQSPAPYQGAARTAQTVAVYLARLFWPAAIYLGATGLDLIYAARLGLIMRSWAKFPDRAGDFDAQMARLKEQKSRRWSSWEMLSGRRRLEIRCAATVIVVAAVLGLRAHLERGLSSSEQVTYQPTPAYAPSAPSAPGVPAENSENGEKSRVLAAAAVVSPACSRSCILSFPFLSCLPIP
jgi:hypothetical protein